MHDIDFNICITMLKITPDARKKIPKNHYLKKAYEVVLMTFFFPLQLPSPLTLHIE